MNRLCLIPLAALCAALTACDDGDTAWTPRPLVASLSHVQTCDELLASLREDAVLKVQDEAARMKLNYREYAPERFDGGVSADAGGGIPEAGGDGAPSHYTDTNTQVAGVDEPDFVKTDGLRIFLVHGRRVEIFSSWPAEETALVGSVEVEGEPVSMFLEGDQLVVFSRIYFADEASEAGSTAPPSFRPVADVWGGSYPYAYRPFTKLTVLDVSGDQPAVAHERYVEGSFRDARRHGDVVRTLIQAPTWDPRWSGSYPSQYDSSGQPHPKLTYYGLVNVWLRERLAEIESRDLDGFLPDEYVVEGGELVPVAPRCDRFYATEPGQATYGMTVALTTDLSDLGTDESLFVLGKPSVVYASHDSLVLAHYDWSWFGLGWATEQRTVVHAFAIDGANTTYSGSGIVPGFVDDQFALDEKDGVLRLALTETLTEEGSWTGTTVNRVLTLAAQGGSLVELGRTPDLAPGERIFATRYVGDKAYVVTFRQVDPLFVIDLSDPSSPALLGELKIPGFSTYMHPLSETHLLTIGRGGDDVGLDLGMQLQIFDVSDPTNPAQVHSHLIDGYSPAEYDHKAFVFDPVTSLLAVPVDVYGESFVSSLRLFHVSVESGFTEAGSIDHSPLFEDCVTYDGYGYYYGCGYSSSMRRGLFIDSYVYAISYGGLSVHALEDVSTPLVVEPLPAPEFYASPYWFEGTPLLF